MNYHPRSKFDRARRALKWVLLLVALYLVGSLVFYVLRPVIMPAVSSFWQAENFFSDSLRAFSTNLRFKKNLLEENQALKERLASYEVMALNYKGFAEREAELASLVGRAEETGGIPATVLVRPPRTPYDTFIIDAGSKNGVAKGMRVALPEGPVLGSVVEVFSRQSKVTLFSSPEMEMEAVLERGGVSATLQGKGGGNFQMYLPRETEVEPGDIVYTSETLPRFLAQVEEAGSNPTDALIEVLLTGPSNIFEIRSVVVLP